LRSILIDTLQDSQIFILSETWFQSHEEYIKEPNFVASTPFPVLQKDSYIFKARDQAQNPNY
jgi:hypothetical protein